MASNKDFEKIWEFYQDVVKTKDVSIVDYCQQRHNKQTFGKSSLKKNKRAEE